MGNASGRDRIQQMDDGEPNLFQPKIIGYPDNEYDTSAKIFLGTDDCENMQEDVEEEPRKQPSVIKWEGGGQTVYVSFQSGVSKIPMVKSQNNFCTVIDLPEGTHHYKFLVDGQWKCDNTKQIQKDKSNEWNVLEVKNSDFEVFEALAVDSLASDSSKTGLSRSPPGSYNQEIPSKHQSSSTTIAPPSLPPQLLQVILNTGSPLQCEPTLLPEPNHVMLNHLYALSIKDEVIVMSGTHRYRKKYVTTLLYKPT